MPDQPKIYQLKAASVAPPCPGHYWRLRKEIAATRGQRVIWQLTQRVLGRVLKVSLMTDEQLAKMIRVFESVLSPAPKTFPPAPAMLPSPAADDSGTDLHSPDSEESSGTVPAAPHRAPAGPHETPARADIFPAPSRDTTAGGASLLTNRQQTAAGTRRILLTNLLPLLEAKNSLNSAAAVLGTSVATLSRLLNTAPVRGAESINLAEKCRRLLVCPVEQLAPAKPESHASPFAVLLTMPAVLAELNRLYVSTMGASCDQATQDRRTGSMATALKRLGDFPEVPSPLAAGLRAGQKPLCLREYLKAQWTPEMEAKLRGQKHYATATVSGRRDLTEEHADGSISNLKPGRVWVLDDMSSNIPFWFECGGDASSPGLAAMIRRHGCAVGRQGLYAWDWATGAWLGLDLIGRLRDAYQASDILRFLRKLMTRYGIPDKIVIERGVWKARCISGWELRDEPHPSHSSYSVVEIENLWQLPEMEVAATAQITDGLRALGVEIIYAYSPRGKPIEGAFHHHQRLVPTFLKPGEAVNIGRHAGEYEWAAHQQRRASDGVDHARDLGFIHIDRLADVAWEAMLWEGRQPKARRPQPPLEMLATFLSASPLRSLNQQNLAVFLPEKRSAALRGGMITCQVNSQTLQFFHPQQFAALGDGMKLDYAFDPAEPTLGAAVYGPRGYLCWADYQPAGPVISARDRSEEPAVLRLKEYKLAHRTAARLLDVATLRTVKIAESRQMPVAATPPSPTGGASVPASRSSAASPHQDTEHTRLNRLAREALLAMTD